MIILQWFKPLQFSKVTVQLALLFYFLSQWWFYIWWLACVNFGSLFGAFFNFKSRQYSLYCKAENIQNTKAYIALISAALATGLGSVTSDTESGLAPPALSRRFCSLLAFLSHLCPWFMGNKASQWDAGPVSHVGFVCAVEAIRLRCRRLTITCKWVWMEREEGCPAVWRKQIRIDGIDPGLHSGDGAQWLDTVHSALLWFPTGVRNDRFWWLTCAFEKKSQFGFVWSISVYLIAQQKTVSPDCCTADWTVCCGAESALHKCLWNTSFNYSCNITSL